MMPVSWKHFLRIMDLIDRTKLRELGDSFWLLIQDLILDVLFLT